MLVELYCLLHSSTALMAKICLLFLAKRSFPSQRSNLDLLALRGRLLLELYMKPGSFLLVVMLLHLSLCFLASVSYQWSEQMATASMPRAHRAKERPAYSSNLPAAMPQLHRNTMGIFTTGKALEREATPNPAEQLLGVTRHRLPQTSPARAAHIHAAGGRPERYKVLPWGQSWGLICLCSPAEETWRGETQPPTSSEPIQRRPLGLATSTRAVGAEGATPSPDKARKLQLFDQSINLFQSDQLGDAGGMACRPGASAQHRRTEKFARQQRPPLRRAAGPGSGGVPCLVFVSSPARAASGRSLAGLG